MMHQARHSSAATNGTWGALRACAPVALLMMLGLATLPTPGSAQSLAEVARQEEARRKAIKKPAKVYTNSSLAPVHGDVIPTPPAPRPDTTPPEAEAAAPAQPAEAAAPEAPAPDERTTREYWRKRLADASEQRDRNAIMLEALQSRINGLLADFTARDDPAQRAVIGENRQKALDELARLQKEHAALEKAIEEIHEEARRLGIPPGWLR